MAVLAQVAQQQNAVQQFQAARQQMQAREAIGPIYQRSIDPATGQLDTNKLMREASADPRTAWMAGDIAKDALARQKAQAEIAQAQTKAGGEQLEQTIKKVQAFKGALSSLAADPSSGPAQAAMTAAQLVNSGVVTQQEAGQYLADMPHDPQQFRAWVQKHQLDTLSAEQRLNAIYGTPQMVNAGGVTMPYAASPVTGARPIGAPIQHTMTPGELAAPRNVFVNGQQGQVPTSSLVDPTGRALSAPTAPGVSFGPNNGRFRPASGAAAAAPIAPVGPPGGPAGFTPTAPRLGAEAAANVQSKESAEQGIALQKTADLVPDRQAKLGTMLADLESFKPGPGSDFEKHIKSVVQRNAEPLAKALGISADSIASQESFDKVATQIFMSQAATLGRPSDLDLKTAMAGSPNSAMSKEGVRRIINMMVGNEDAIAAKNRAWQAYQQQGAGPESYGQFSTEFNKVFDPRVFQAVRMVPEERKAMLNSMSQEERNAFRAKVNLAAQNGWITVPGRGNAR